MLLCLGLWRKSALHVGAPCTAGPAPPPTVKSGVGQGGDVGPSALEAHNKEAIAHRDYKGPTESWSAFHHHNFKERQ